MLAKGPDDHKHVNELLAVRMQKTQGSCLKGRTDTQALGPSPGTVDGAFTGAWTLGWWAGVPVGPGPVRSRQLP